MAYPASMEMARRRNNKKRGVRQSPHTVMTRLRVAVRSRLPTRWRKPMESSAQASAFLPPPFRHWLLARARDRPQPCQRAWSRRGQHNKPGRVSASTKPALLPLRPVLTSPAPPPRSPRTTPESGEAGTSSVRALCSSNAHGNCQARRFSKMAEWSRRRTGSRPQAAAGRWTLHRSGVNV